MTTDMSFRNASRVMVLALPLFVALLFSTTHAWPFEDNKPPRTRDEMYQRCLIAINSSSSSTCTTNSPGFSGGFDRYAMDDQMLYSIQWIDAGACCHDCSVNPECTFWQFIPGIPADEREPAFPDECKIYRGAPDCKAYYWDGKRSGACRPGAYNDPHFVGARGTRYDFNGRPDRAFCLLTDRDVHVNMMLRGYYSEDTRNATLVVDGKAVHTWIKELGIVWFANGATHTARLVARNGKQQRRGDGFMKAIEIDGQLQQRMRVGDIIVPSNGTNLTITFKAEEKEGPFDVDYYTLEIQGLLSLDVKMRIAQPKLQTPTDAEVHMNVGVAEFTHTDAIHGVLGQTYRADHAQRAVDFQKLVAAVHHPVSADGEEGKGFLDGTPRSYEATGVLATDCAFAAYSHA